jgi:hypothetical protein
VPMCGRISIGTRSQCVSWAIAKDGASIFIANRLEPSTSKQTRLTQVPNRPSTRRARTSTAPYLRVMSDDLVLRHFAPPQTRSSQTLGPVMQRQYAPQGMVPKREQVIAGNNTDASGIDSSLSGLPEIPIRGDNLQGWRSRRYSASVGAVLRRNHPHPSRLGAWVTNSTPANQ